MSLITDLNQIYTIKQEIKTVLNTQEDQFSYYPDLIEAAMGGSYAYIPDGYTYVDGTYNIVENGTFDVSAYASAYVDITAEIPSGYVLPTGYAYITTNGDYNIANYEMVNVTVQGGGSGTDYVTYTTGEVMAYAGVGSYINTNMFLCNWNQAYYGTADWENDVNQFASPAISASDGTYMYLVIGDSADPDHWEDGNFDGVLVFMSDDDPATIFNGVESGEADAKAMVGMLVNGEVISAGDNEGQTWKFIKVDNWKRNAVGGLEATNGNYFLNNKYSYVHVNGPSGTISIGGNGTYYVSGYEYAEVSVQGGGSNYSYFTRIIEPDAYASWQYGAVNISQPGAIGSIQAVHGMPRFAADNCVEINGTEWIKGVAGNSYLTYDSIGSTYNFGWDRPDQSNGFTCGELGYYNFTVGNTASGESYITITSADTYTYIESIWGEYPEIGNVTYAVYDPSEHLYTISIDCNSGSQDTQNYLLRGSINGTYFPVAIDNGISFGDEEIWDSPEVDMITGEPFTEEDHQANDLYLNYTGMGQVTGFTLAIPDKTVAAIPTNLEWLYSYCPCVHAVITPQGTAPEPEPLGETCPNCSEWNAHMIDSGNPCDYCGYPNNE